MKEMINLNLVDQNKSDIKYQISKFPDGQQQVNIKSKFDTNIEEGIGDILSVTINSRLNDFKDLEIIICATKSLRDLGIKEIHLYTPYFLGSRSDRKFEDGSNNYLKDVICPIINGLNFESVTVLDPHSDVLEACLNNFKKEKNHDLVDFAIKSIYNTFFINRDDADVYNNYVLVSPDAGATKKIYKLSEEIKYVGDVITCIKDRDDNGKLTKTVVPYLNKYSDKDLIIIDDICDGGATFLNIAKEIRMDGKHNGKIYLIISHGIFSKGFSELVKHFDGIYTTNSYSDIFNNNLVKQLDIF